MSDTDNRLARILQSHGVHVVHIANGCATVIERFVVIPMSLDGTRAIGPAHVGECEHVVTLDTVKDWLGY